MAPNSVSPTLTLPASLNTKPVFRLSPFTSTPSTFSADNASNAPKMRPLRIEPAAFSTHNATCLLCSLRKYTSNPLAVPRAASIFHPGNVAADNKEPPLLICTTAPLRRNA